MSGPAPGQPVRPASPQAVSAPREGCGLTRQERMLSRAIDAVIVAQPAINPATARAALERAAPTTLMARTLAKHLASHPRALVDGDSAAPRALQRLIGELRAAGVEGLVDPRCLDCDKPKPLEFPVEGGRVCNACQKRRRPPERCARCAKIAPRAARDEHGQPVCSTCHGRSFVRLVHRCTLCGINRTFRTRSPVCKDCFERPRTSCATCGLPAPIPPADTAACCARCALAPPAPCSVCGEPTAGRDRKGRARCEKCYQRPVGTCGRCGRVRAITRLATGEDPDLCALCWTGPTVTCEGCGRLRPCRGQRRGRMLCSACAPVAPQRCAHCQRRRRAAAHWPEGPVCGTCYARALAAKDDCPSCGQTRRLLHYPGFPDPVCRHCAGAAPDHVCGQCGAEDNLYYRGLCARCALARRLTELLGEPTERGRVGLDGLFDALHGARSPKDTLRWLADSPATPVLGQIARGELACTHQTLNRLAPSEGRQHRWALEHLRHLLVATSGLPPRDPALGRLERWIEDFLAAHDSQPELRTFAHWIILRRARTKSRRAPLNEGALGSAKTELRSAAAFLDWLAAQDRPLADCRQGDIDAWLNGPRPDRHVARSFARWATGRGLIPKLDFPAGKRTGPIPAVSDQDRLQLARRLLHDPTLPTRDRVAALLIVLFGQPVSRVARLTVDDVTIDQDAVTICLGATAIALPEPLAGHLRDLIADRRSGAAAAIRQPRWLFLGKAPGRPIGAFTLSRRLKDIGVDCADARRTALLQLAGQIPAALLADLLGIHVHTAAKWAEIAGRPWGDYPTLRDR